MSTSGAYVFNPSLGELGLYAMNLAGIRNTAITAEHMMTLRMAANLVQATWANKGVNLWAVDLVTTPLVQGQATYQVDPSTVVVLDAYVTIDDGISPPTDRYMLPISRTQYASYPNKTVQGFPTVYWNDRLLAPTITLWQVPDGVSAQYLKYYRLRQSQDAQVQAGITLDVPYLWLEAFAHEVAWRIALSWMPDKVQILKPIADELYKVAADRNVEIADFYITPQISNYFRA